MNIFSKTERLSLKLFCAAVIVAALFLAVRFILPALIPFLIALLIASLIKKPVLSLRAKARIPEKLTAAIFVLLIIGMISMISYLLLSRACREIVSLTDSAGTFIDRLKNDPDFAGEMIDKINSFFPFWDLRPRLTELWINIDSSLEALLMALVEKLSGSVLPVITGAVSFVPDALLFVFVTAFSAFYLTVDGSAMKARITSLMPEKAAAKCGIIWTRCKETVGCFAKAYTLIMAITFTELFVAFSIIGIRYAFLVALFTAVIDILPVLGTGTVLIPWATFLLVRGDTKTGISLLVVYAVITLIRELIEPRIVGGSIGISPFASLASMYIGLRLFGAAGLFICPLAVIAAQNIVKSKTESAKIQ